MNVIDVVIILMILLCGIIGFKRGVLKQLVSTVGFVIVVILSFYLKNPLAEYMSLHFPFFKFGGLFSDVSSLNIILYHLVSFILVIIVLEAVLSIIIKLTGLIEKLLKYTIILGIPSKILGFFVGIVEGFIFIFIALFFLRQPCFGIDILDDSKLTDKILNSTPILSNVAGGFVNSFNDLYQLGEEYHEAKFDTKKLDLKSIDVMLEHKIITPDYVNKLIDADKINIEGIDTVINKYRKEK